VHCVDTNQVRCYATALVEQVPSEISDFTPCAHVQSNILHIKYTEKTDD